MMFYSWEELQSVALKIDTRSFMDFNYISKTNELPNLSYSTSLNTHPHKTLQEKQNELRIKQTIERYTNRGNL